MFRKKLVVLIALVAAIGILIWGVITLKKPEQVAFEDYVQNVKDAPKENLAVPDSSNPLQLSEFSIPVYSPLPDKKIITYKGEGIADMLLPTNERLWFMMNGTEAEGIVVATDKEPIKMGGENRSKELLQIYKKARDEVTRDDDILYFEYVGHSIMVTVSDNREKVYLTRSAADVLDLATDTAYQPEKVISKMRQLSKQTPN
ncbi:hypothetical protein [Paenibacillus faecalis]|uniref:hypothetical protein n=1 Tax=Paenibacillus faecalis TaxID=2079532 RepID=UPI000D1008D1|nr:hypothetical protein [Paenibacillus faecalis]